MGEGKGVQGMEVGYVVTIKIEGERAVMEGGGGMPSKIDQGFASSSPTLLTTSLLISSPSHPHPHTHTLILALSLG